MKEIKQPQLLNKTHRQKKNRVFEREHSEWVGGIVFQSWKISDDNKINHHHALPPPHSPYVPRKKRWIKKKEERRDWLKTKEIQRRKRRRTIRKKGYLIKVDTWETVSQMTVVRYLGILISSRGSLPLLIICYIP